MLLSFKYRLYPTRAQAVELDRMLAGFCALYNVALQQRIEAYRRQSRALRYVDQAGELRAVRAACPELAAYSYSAEQQVLRRLDKAFRSFFRRLRMPGVRAGFPRFKAARRFHAAGFRVGDGLTLRKGGRLGVVGIPGEIKVKWHRPLPEGVKLGAAVLTRQAGKWYVVFQVEMPEAPPTERPFAPVGIDVGLSALITLSTGETVPCPPWTKAVLGSRISPGGGTPRGRPRRGRAGRRAIVPRTLGGGAEPDRRRAWRVTSRTQPPLVEAGAKAPRR